jgi:hypothetical protein
VKKTEGADELILPSNKEDSANVPPASPPPANDLTTADACASPFGEPPNVQTGQAALFVAPQLISLDPASPDRKSVWVTSRSLPTDLQEKPVVEIQKYCEPSTECTSIQVPPGGPSLTAFLVGTTCQRDDLVPATEKFEVGTFPHTQTNPETSHISTNAEVLLNIGAGTVPGKYVVSVIVNRITLTAPFEVIASPSTVAIESLKASRLPPPKQSTPK